MSWQMLAGDVVKHGKLALALTCVGMARLELVEFSILEEPRGHDGPLSLGGRCRADSATT